MRNILVVITMAIAGMLLFSFSRCASAQEQDSSAFAYGTVVSITDGEIVVREYDYEKDEEIDNTYVINVKTEYEGVKTFKDIVLGDSVDVVYAVIDNQKVAQSLSIEKPTDD